MSDQRIVVLGAGPAGLAAADAVSEHGHRVVIVDDNHAPGGQVWRGGPAQWVQYKDPRAARLWRSLSGRADVELLSGARVVAAAGPRTLLIESAHGPLALPWSRLVVCTGARELLLPFPGWTLPGVTGAGALQALLKGGMPIAGKRVVVAGTGPLLLAVADAVQRHGGIVAAIVEHQGTAALARFGARLALSHRRQFVQALRLLSGLRRVPYLRGALVRQACGDGVLASVQVEQAGRRRAIECDCLACGFGLVPALETASLFGCATRHGSVTVDAFQRTSVDGVWAAGESTGIGGVDQALAQGRIAGLDAVGKQASGSERSAVDAAHDFARLLAATFAAPAAMRDVCQGSTLVCRCEDVPAAALAGKGSWREAKLQTRVGMGPCQGRVCGAACAFLYGWDCSAVRPPVHPALASTLASVGAPIANSEAARLAPDGPESLH